MKERIVGALRRFAYPEDGKVDGLLAEGKQQPLL